MEMGVMVAQLLMHLHIFNHVCVDIFWMLSKHLQFAWIGSNVNPWKPAQNLLWSALGPCKERTMRYLPYGTVYQPRMWYKLNTITATINFHRLIHLSCCSVTNESAGFLHLFIHTLPQSQNRDESHNASVTFATLETSQCLVFQSVACNFITASIDGQGILKCTSWQCTI